MKIDRNETGLSLSFRERQKRLVVAAACRATLMDLARNSRSDTGAYLSSHEDEIMLPLAKIACHITERSEDAKADVTPREFFFVKYALWRFANPEHTKRAIDEHRIRANLLIGDAAVEQRVLLGHMAGGLLEEVDPAFAAANEADIQRMWTALEASTGAEAAAEQLADGASAA